MHFLIVGYGSIGARHARLLEEQGHDLHAVTNNSECPYPTSVSVKEALQIFTPDGVIISTPTSAHHKTLVELENASYSGKILVEKPLFDAFQTFTPANATSIHVAYNMRYHPVILRARDLLQNKSIYSAQFHVGQYLPDWRPDTDYTKCYSAHRDQGGGVLRDLSHELDMALWLLGSWRRVTALGGTFSSLEITSDDVFSILMETTHCPAASIHLDYLNRRVRRGFDINAEGLSLRADLVESTLEINGELEVFPMERDTTYTAQIAAITSDSFSNQCTYDEGLAVLNLIKAVETSVKERSWIVAK